MKRRALTRSRLSFGGALLALFLAGSPAKAADWWRTLADPGLDALEGALHKASPDLAAAQARRREALAYLERAKADRSPQIELDASGFAERQSDLRPLRGGGQPDQFGLDTIDAAFSWEIDLWGRVAKRIALARAEDRASAADLAAVQLTLEAQLAETYVRWRAVQADEHLIEDTLKSDVEILDRVQVRYDQGAADLRDLELARSVVESVRTQLFAARRQETDLIGVLAVLTGRSAQSFTPPEAVVSDSLPPLVEDLPLDLLARRPDVAAADSRLAAADAALGLARRAYLPTLSLSALIGFQNGGQSGLLTWPDRLWALGPAATLPLVDGGRRKAQTRAAAAERTAAAEALKAVTLRAAADVFSSVRAEREILGQLEAQTRAARSTDRTLGLARVRYEAGVGDFFELADAQRRSLTEDRGLNQVRTEFRIAWIRAIRAAGGQWSAP